MDLRSVDATFAPFGAIVRYSRGVGPSQPDGNVRVIGRYALYGPLAAGGMATVHFGRLLGPVGFSRTVAIKRLHAQFAQDPEFVSMFLDEARLAARIRHPNVVPTLDVVATDGELFLVMDYVAGESLARLARTFADRGTRMPFRIASAIMAGVLHGLHAAHEAKDERGMALGIVHRDVSPQNVLVGTDGVAKILDFGVAKAAGRSQTTREGQIKGKLAYMPPEQLRGMPVTRGTDIYAAGVVLWELVTGQRLFSGDNEGVIVAKVLHGDVQSPSSVLAEKGARLTGDEVAALPRLERILFRALAATPEERFATAKEMAVELERAVPPATSSDVGEWVEVHAHVVLEQRAVRVAEIESGATDIPLEARPSGRMPTAVAVVANAENPTRIVSPSNPDITPPVTQPSSLSVVTGTSSIPAARPNANSWVFVLGIAVLALLVIGGGVAFRYSKTTPTVGAEPTASAPLGSGPSTSPSAPPTASTPSAVVVGVGVSPEPSASAPTPPHTGASTASTPPKKPPPFVPKPANTCSPPYTTDVNGIRHYKPGCI